VIRVHDEADVRALEQNDPAVMGGIGFSYEVLPMLAAVVRD
jgi:hypothetical protein